MKTITNYNNLMNSFQSYLVKKYIWNINDYTLPPFNIIYIYILCAFLYTFVRRILMFCFMITTTFLIIAFYYSCSVQLSR